VLVVADRFRSSPFQTTASTLLMLTLPPPTVASTSIGSFGPTRDGARAATLTSGTTTGWTACGPSWIAPTTYVPGSRPLVSKLTSAEPRAFLNCTTFLSLS
jgi:hypothetical protein